MNHLLENRLEHDTNPYQSPAETPGTGATADDAQSRLSRKVERYSNGIIVRRWAATLIDFVVMVGFIACCDAFLGNALYQKVVPIILFLLALYYPVLEGFEGGTAGKFALGIRVVDYDGRRPGMLKALVRTLARIVEVNPFCMGGLPAGIVAMMSPRKQRIGDMLAKTLVVYQDDVA